MPQHNIYVISRFVTIHDRYGRRVRQPRWGKPRLWKQHPDTAQNLYDATQYAEFSLKMYNTGTVVYLKRDKEKPMPIFHTKFGSDGSHFIGWKPSPLAEYWRRKLKVMTS